MSKKNTKKINQKNVKMKKSVSVGLITVLAASNMFLAPGVTYAETGNSSTGLDKLYKELPTPDKQILQNDQFAPGEKVRVIVELEGAPAIEYATKKNKSFKDLKQTEKNTLESAIKAEQAEFLSDVKSDKIAFDMENSFTTVMNGVSGEVQYKEIEKIKKFPGVESVSIVNEYERPKEKPDMLSSKDMVEAIQTWNAGYKGDGVVVGVIDTGIDNTHKDMQAITANKVKLTKSKTESIIAEQKLPGKYYSLKIPYGYNYADKNSNILDEGPDASMHGMHVAGTVGANGDETKDGIKGVAPEAQLLALKVFGNDPGMPSTFGDIYIKAIDDAIKLGADVLNMSLGSPAGFVADEDAEQKAVDRAVQNGIVMAISAGNEDNVSSQFGGSPYAKNPDIGMVGSPSVSKSSLSVASIENTKITLEEMTMKIGGVTLPIAYKKQSSPNPLEVFGNKELDVVYVGDGSANGYKNKDVKGKVVLAARNATNPNYGAIQAEAEKQGAAGVIVKPLAAHGDYVSMALNAPTIPLVSLSISDGNTLIEKLTANGGVGKVSYTGKTMQVINSASGTMSAFTSWGVTPSLEFKPEITAPGGQIYSTFNDNKYGIMSGTSMAAPHVAGGSALVLQRVKELFPNLTGAERSKRAKTILMNTSKPVEDPNANNVFYSPRRQGAGIMQLHSAVSTPVYVVNKGTNEGKVELKEITGDSFTMTLTATNVSDEDVTYKVDTSVLTDAVANGNLLLKEQIISKAKVTVDVPQFTLMGKGATQDIKVRVDLKDAKAELEQLMENGYFVEGFVRLINQSDKPFPNLTVPYVGYKGDWNKPSILDSMVYDDDSYVGISVMVDDAGYDMGYNPLSKVYDKNTIAISPNGDKENDAIAPVLTFLRNSKEVEYSIVDSTGKTIRTLTKDQNQRKNYKATAPYVYKPSYTLWNGYAKNQKVADGKYYYQVKTLVDYAGKEPQVVKIPVWVDTVKPEVSKIAYSNKQEVLSFKATDQNGSGVQYVQVLVDGKSLGYLDATGKTNFKVKIPGIKQTSTITVAAFDNGLNVGSSSVTGSWDNTVPYVITTAPEALGVYNTKTVPVVGYVRDASDMEFLTISGDTLEGKVVEVPLTYNKTTGNYNFNTQITFTADGVHDIRFTALDAVGNNIDFLRQIFVDTTPAELTVTGIPTGNVVPVDGADPDMKLNVKDNFDDIRVVVDGDEIAKNVFDEPFTMRGFDKTYDLPVSLNQGKNEIVIEVTDLGGHVTKKTIVIYKGDAPAGAVTTSYEYGLNGEASADNPFTFTANASKDTKWEAKVIAPSGKEIELDSAEGKSYTASYLPDELGEKGMYRLVFGPAGGEKTEVAFTVNNYSMKIEGKLLDERSGDGKNEFTNDEILTVSSIAKLEGLSKAGAQVIMQVKNSNDEVVLFKSSSIANVGNNKAFNMDFDLADLDKGKYTVEIFVWSSLENPIPLAQSTKTTFTIK